MMPPNCYRTRPAAASSPHPLIIITSCMHPCADHYHHQQFASWTEGAGVRQCRGIEERVEGWGQFAKDVDGEEIHSAMDKQSSITLRGASEI